MFEEKDSINIVRMELPGIFPRLWRYCLVQTGNHDNANELSQMTCLRALEKASDFVPGTHFDRWIFRVSQRVWLNDLRSQAVRRGKGLVSIEEIDIADMKSDIETSVLASQMINIIQRLPEAQRMAVLLVYVEGFSYREAADIMDIPAGTIMSRLSGARAKISNQLK